MNPFSVGKLLTLQIKWALILALVVNANTGSSDFLSHTILSAQSQRIDWFLLKPDSLHRN